MKSIEEYRHFAKRIETQNSKLSRIVILLLLLANSAVLGAMAFLEGFKPALLVFYIPTICLLLMSFEPSFDKALARLTICWLLIFAALMSCTVASQRPSALFALALAISQLLFLLDDLSSWTMSTLGYAAFCALCIVFKPRAIWMIDVFSQAFTLVFSCLLGYFIRKSWFRALKTTEDLERRNGQLRIQNALEYKAITKQTLHTIARTIDAKDEYTKGHSIRVAAYAQEIGKRMGLDSSHCESLFYTALLHDIGKIGIPEEILNKKGKLTKEEYEIVKTHPAIGGRILSSFVAIDGIAEGAVYHHERYDGAGYTHQLKGSEIPLSGRIIGACDAFDALTSDRSYRKAYEKSDAKALIQEGSGKQFDPEVVRILVDIIDSGFDPDSSAEAKAFSSTEES
ncbi:MAG: HD-GYP domain-containing protein [Sphaerochaetaceae bacterium]|jgi:hypothetical protein|nr:HD-GYP domain-containing protein [Sphaerochaetaceae bacterium]